MGYSLTCPITNSRSRVDKIYDKVTDEEFPALQLGDCAAMQPRPINHDFDKNKNLSQAAAISCGSDQGVWLQ